jgi:hypothetical protein
LAWDWDAPCSKYAPHPFGQLAALTFDGTQAVFAPQFQICDASVLTGVVVASEDSADRVRSTHRRSEVSASWT